MDVGKGEFWTVGTSAELEMGSLKRELVTIEAVKLFIVLEGNASVLLRPAPKIFWLSVELRYALFQMKGGAR